MRLTYASLSGYASPVICPSCGEEMEPEGVEIAPPLAICPACEHSIVIAKDQPPRVARADDVAGLDDVQRGALIRLRQHTLADRRAYYAKHHGR